MAQDHFNTTARQQILDPVAAVADTNTASYDKLNFNTVHMLAMFGEEGVTLDGSDYIEVFLEHSTDNSVWALVTNPIYLTGVMETVALGLVKTINDAALDDALYEIEYKGPNRYVRLRFEFTGTHGTGTPVSALAIGAFPRFQGRNQHSDASTAGA